MKDGKPQPETPPLTRAGRMRADATLAAAKFKTAADGRPAVREFEVHGIAVTEYPGATDATLTAAKFKQKSPAVRL